MTSERPERESADLDVSSVDCVLPLVGSELSRLGLRGLHCGCGMNFQAGWLNLDITALSCRGGAATQRGRVVVLDHRFHYMEADVTQALPIEDSSVDRVYAEHLVEHLSFDEAVRWMSEMRRVVRDGGLLRVTTPDLRKYMAGYTGEDPEFFREHRERLLRMGVDQVPTRRTWMLNQIFQMWGHEWIYDLDEIATLAERAGFAPGAVVECAYRRGSDTMLAGLDKEIRCDETLYVEIHA